MLPLSYRSSPKIVLASSDLPAPSSPQTPVMVPGYILRLMPSYFPALFRFFSSRIGLTSSPMTLSTLSFWRALLPIMAKISSSFVVDLVSNSPLFFAFFNAVQWSLICNTSSRKCEMKIKDTPFSFSFASRSKKITFSFSLSEEVGSSSTRTFEFRVMAFRISMICFSAALRSPTRSVARIWIFSWSMSSWASR